MATAKPRKSTGRRKVEPAWLPLNAQIGTMANQWSKRNDLIAYIGSDGGKGVAPAIFTPKTAEIEINTQVAFGEHIEPLHVDDFTDRKVQLDWPKAAGFVMHEAAHARWTTCDLQRLYNELKEEVVGVKGAHENYMLLEESRIERNMAQARPADRVFLRSSALTLTVDEINEEDENGVPASHSMNPTTLAARMALLTLARVDGKVLKNRDVVTIRAQVMSNLGENIYGRMRKLWKEFHTLTDDGGSGADYERMKEIAVEMTKLITEAHEQNGTEDQQQSGGTPQPGAGGGQPLTQEQMDALGDLLDALQEDADTTEQASGEEAYDEKTAQVMKEAADKLNKENKEQDENRKVAQTIFSKHRESSGRTRSRLTKERTPESAERIAANNIAKALQRAKYRDRIRIESQDTVPPGRLKVGQAMQGRAIKSAGGNSEVRPWHRVMHRHVEDPNLVVGVMCDISGSMSYAMEPISVSAWVMSEAVKRIQGKIASVYYGESVFSVLKPGEHLEKVRIYSANDSMESFDAGFRALDGTLGLLAGRGARLLVICSDGQYTEHEEKRAHYWLKKCQERGVAVVWLTYNDWINTDLIDNYGIKRVKAEGGVTNAANIIGQACVDALKR